MVCVCSKQPISARLPGDVGAARGAQQQVGGATSAGGRGLVVKGYT